MRSRLLLVISMAISALALSASAADWPQWRGPNRDNKVTGFTEPKTWPKELAQKWKVTVGQGDASPVLAGGKLFVFARQGGDEVILCLDANTGKEVWKDKYAAQAVEGPARSHPGPRSTPAVAEGKVCTLGVAGVLSCLDAATGKVVWRKDTKAYPRFYTASSPLIIDGKCIAFVGGGKGEVIAYDLASGEEKMKWTGPGAPYGSPMIMTVEGTKQIVTPTASSVVGIGLADGKLLWSVPFKAKYMNCTPIIDGQTVIYAGEGTGTVAIRVEKKGDGFEAKELWKKGEGPGQYNTPVLKDGVLYGIRGAGRGSGNFFCMNAQTGDVLWTDKGRCGDCGSILDAGSVLLAVTNNSELVAFKPSNKGFEQLARCKVADKTGIAGPWGCPIIDGNRIFVKDQNSLTLWTLP